MKKDMVKDNANSKALASIKYRNNQAIEYARGKCGMGWDNNRQRLSFYEFFDEYYRKNQARR